MALQHCQSGRTSKNSTSSKEDKNNQVQRNNILLSLKHNFHEFSEFEMLSHYSHIIIPFYLKHVKGELILHSRAFQALFLISLSLL